LGEDEIEYLPNRVVDENLSNAASDDGDDPTIVIPFQNENFVCVYGIAGWYKNGQFFSFFQLVLNRWQAF